MGNKKEQFVAKSFITLVLTASFLLIQPALFGQNLDDFEKRLTKFTLSNGMKFIVLERHEAPVISFFTYVDVGSVDEVKGITGLAHIFEHMAFKGNQFIGTKDYKAESDAMAEADSIFEEIKAEQRKGEKADKARIEQLEKKFSEVRQKAAKYIVHDEFEEILTREGASGLNAFTGNDTTGYVSSFPSNKLQLWMLMESGRFATPVLREFYEEKNVIMEERRMSENNPQSRLMEEYLALAFKAHPYGEPIIGHMSDLQTLTRKEAVEFFKKHYSPNNLTAAIVGDVDPQEAKKYADMYFGALPRGPVSEPVETVEPPQLGERRIVLKDMAQPMIIIGFHTVSINHPDNAAFDVLNDILSSGRTSRLYKSLIKDKKIAVSASASGGFPGEKYPGLFAFFALPSRGHTNAECEQAINEQIQLLKNEPVTDDELQKAKTRVRAGLIRQLGSNMGLARQLASYEVLTGDWRNLFKRIDEIDKISAADIQRIAKEYFIEKNRTVGAIETITEKN